MIVKGLPILDRDLKRLIVEIQEKADTVCKESKGTAIEDIACDIKREVLRDLELGSTEEMTQKIEDIIYILEKRMADFPENKYLLNKIESTKHERNLTKQLDSICFLIQEIPKTKYVPEHEYNEMITHLNEIIILIGELPDKSDVQKFYV